MDLKIKCHILIEIKTCITIKRKLLVNYFDYLLIVSFNFQAEMFKHLLLFWSFNIKKHRLFELSFFHTLLTFYRTNYKLINSKTQ